MARAEGQPLHGELRMGVIPTIAPFLLPAMLPRLRQRMAEPEALPARGDQPGRLRGAPPRPARLRAARPPLRLRRDRFRALVRRPSCSSPSRAAKPARGQDVDVPAIDEDRMLLLEDGHCLKDHALAACNRPELRAHAAMMGTSLHTLVQMVDNGLGVTFIPSMAIEAGILEGTQVDAKPLRSDHGYRQIALIWRRSSPREFEFQLLAATLRQIMRRHQSRARAIAPVSREPAAELVDFHFGHAATPGRGGLAPRRPKVRLLGHCRLPMRWPMTAPPGETGRNGRHSSPWSRPRRSPGRTSLRCPSRHRPRRSPAAGCSSRNQVGPGGPPLFAACRRGHSR